MLCGIHAIVAQLQQISKSLMTSKHLRSQATVDQSRLLALICCKLTVAWTAHFYHCM